MNVQEKNTNYNQLLFSTVHGPDGAKNQKMRKRLDWIANEIPEDAIRILDLGSGQGVLTNILSEKGKKVTALDLVYASLKKIHTPSSPVQASGAQLPFRDNSFDCVLCIEVLEHLSEQMQKNILSEIFRVSKSHILVAVPNQENLREALVRCDKCGTIFHSWGHLHSFSEADLNALFPGMLLKIDTLSRPGTSYYWPLLLIRQTIFHTYGYDELLVCPSCNNRDIKEPKRTLVVKILDRLNYWLGIQTPSGWILGIYKKGHKP